MEKAGLHSPGTKLHVTGGGSAIGARLVALALHRTAYYGRRLGDGSKPCGTRLAPNCMLQATAWRWEQALWRSPCIELHVTGGGSAMGEQGFSHICGGSAMEGRLVALALHRNSYLPKGESA